MNASQSTGTHALEVSRTTRDIERSFDGSILSLPLIPSFVAFVAAVSSSVVYNVTDVNTCPLYLRAFVLGNIVWSYVFILSYGFILVGPKMNDIIGTLLIFIIHFVLHLALVLFGSFQIYTSWNEGGSCKTSPIFYLALALAGTFALCTVCFLLFLTIYGIKRSCCQDGSNMDVAALGDKRAEKLSAQRLSVETEMAALGGVGARDPQPSRPLEQPRQRAVNAKQEHARPASGSAEIDSASSASDDL